MVAAHLFVADLDEPAVAADDRHHVERVLRLRAGEEVTASDGRGGVRSCVVRRAGDDGPITLEAVAAVERFARPEPDLTVGFALVKGDRPEWIVQKLTECGVDRIVPFVAARTVVKWDGHKAARNAERLRRVAHEAAMQSRRPWLPEVTDVVRFAEIAALVAPTVPALADAHGDPPTLAHPAILVGPEGGWAPEELAAGGPRVRLGPHVYRAETAAIAAGIVLSLLREGLLRPR